MSSSKRDNAAGFRGLLAARNVAHRIKERSTFLVQERRRKEPDDVGEYLITHSDYPELAQEDFFAIAAKRKPRISTIDKVSDFNLNFGSLNTYQMSPTNRFQEFRAREIMEKVFQERLDGVKYDSKVCAKLSKTLSEEIKTQVKALGYTRYKFICTVTIGQEVNEGLRITSRCVWDAKFDNFAEFVYKSEDLYAVGLVFGVYCE